MPCKDTAGGARRRCIDWETRTRRDCARWRIDQTQRCDNWQTSSEQRCTASHVENERRCDRWENETSRTCASWSFPFNLVCLIWNVVTTAVCRLWNWVSRTVCDVWTWVTTTVCRLWVWVTVAVCTLWTVVVSIVCRTWLFVLDTWCSFGCLFGRLAAPAEVSQARSECIYGWTSAYRAEFDERECVLRIVLRLRLVPQAGVSAQDVATVQARWEPAIERHWSGQFPLRRDDGSCACESVRVACDVQWVASGEHHAVELRAGNGRADMTHWFVGDDGDTAAHEAGHMFGNADEYMDSACPARTVTSDNSLMQTTAGSVRTRHYASFERWLTLHSCCTYRAAA
jgi:hypothetical protein